MVKIPDRDRVRLKFCYGSSTRFKLRVGGNSREQQTKRERDKAGSNGKTGHTFSSWPVGEGGNTTAQPQRALEV